MVEVVHRCTWCYRPTPGPPWLRKEMSGLYCVDCMAALDGYKGLDARNEVAVKRLNMGAVRRLLTQTDD